MVEGLPTQFVPSPNPLAREAIAAAAEIDYEGVVVRVVRPEYLNRGVVDEILERHGLSF